MKFIPCIMSCFLIFLLFNAPGAMAQTEPWRCVAEDSTHKKWVGFAFFRISAKQKALEECKKNAVFPHSCKASGEDSCQAPFHSSSHPEGLWVCMALDRYGAAWTNVGKADRWSAAIAARDFCRAKSAIPKTCTINTVTCKKRKR